MSMTTKIYDKLALTLAHMEPPVVTVGERTTLATVATHANSRCRAEQSSTPAQLRKFVEDALAQAAAWEALAQHAEKDQGEKQAAALDALTKEYWGTEYARLTARAQRVIFALYEALNPEARA